MSNLRHYIKVRKGTRVVAEAVSGDDGEAVQVDIMLTLALKGTWLVNCSNFLKAHPFQRFDFNCQPAPLHDGIYLIPKTPAGNCVISAEADNHSMVRRCRLTSG